jgi:hypothetical protein
MSKQWKATTRGGDPVESVRPRNCSVWKWTGEVVNSDGSKATLTWTEHGFFRADGQPDEDDLIPIEPEAPRPAKVRVDLALAAYGLRAAVANRQHAEAQEDKMGEALFDAFAASGKTEAVVGIDGEHYYFWTKETRVFFRKIEVL